MLATTVAIQMTRNAGWRKAAKADFAWCSGDAIGWGASGTSLIMATVAGLFQALLWLHVAISNREADNEIPAEEALRNPQAAIAMAKGDR